MHVTWAGILTGGVRDERCVTCDMIGAARCDKVRQGVQMSLTSRLITPFKHIPTHFREKKTPLSLSLPSISHLSLHPNPYTTVHINPPQ